MSVLKSLPNWLFIAMIGTILSIIAHEIAHYLGAVLMGGEDVRLHWADVSYLPSSLNPMGEAVMALAGPALTHGIIIWVWLSRATNLAALSIGLGACSRDLLLLPYTLKSLLGRDVSRFFGDEVQGAQALGWNPLPLAFVAVALGAAGLVVFLSRSSRAHGTGCALVLLAGTIAGIALWSAVGPAILPGGRGLD